MPNIRRVANFVVTKTEVVRICVTNVKESEICWGLLLEKLLPIAVQICQNLFKRVQTCSNLSKCVQTCPNLFKRVQICSNLSKFVQTSSTWSKLV